MNRVDRAGNGLSTTGLRRQGVIRALEAMRLRLSDQMTLEYLARTAAMSRFHFERVFHEVTGLSPFQFLSAMRFVRARELVLQTDASIIDICFHVGYSSVGTFTRRFTAQVGASPRHLRRFSANRHAVAARPAGRHRLAGCGADIVVHCRGASDDTLIFVGAFASRAPIGRPEACATTAGTGTVVLRNVPPGTYYVLGATEHTSPAPDQPRGGEVLVGTVEPAPVRVEGQALQEVTMQLRPVEVTDPPVVSFLPLLFHETCSQPPEDDEAALEPEAASPVDGSQAQQAHSR
jgi:AraC family transcriptional regulator